MLDLAACQEIKCLLTRLQNYIYISGERTR